MVFCCPIFPRKIKPAANPPRALPRVSIAYILPRSTEIWWFDLIMILLTTGKMPPIKKVGIIKSITDIPNMIISTPLSARFLLPSRL